VDARRRRGSDDMGAALARELRREVTHAAGRAVDQDPLSRLETTVVEEPLPRGQPRHRDRRALDVIEACRFRRQEVRGNEGVLGGDAVAVERGQRIHLGAHRGLRDPGTDGLDDAGQLVRRDRRQAVDGPLELVPGDRGGVHAHERFRGSVLRHFDVVEREPVAAGVGVEPDRAHLLRARHL